MKIKLVVANYGDNQLGYLNRMIEEFKGFKNHVVDITVYTTVPVEYPHVLVSPEIGDGLPFVNRQEMIDAVDDYDLFIYNENDMLITEDNIEAFLEHSVTLLEGEVSGFIRYEIDDARGVILLDPNPYWGPITENKTVAGFQLLNRHQGCWVLLQKDFRKAIASGGFVLEKHHGPYGALEQGASDPYTQCGLTKVFPLDYSLCERLLIHHMPNKYIKYPEWIHHGIRLKDLLSFYT